MSLWRGAPRESIAKAFLKKNSEGAARRLRLHGAVPVASGQCADVSMGESHQVGHNREDRHPIPGVSVRIVDRRPGASPSREKGLLLVKGPTSCRILGEAEKTAEAIRNGCM